MLKANNLYLPDHQYILTAYFFDIFLFADQIECKLLNDRAAYIILREILFAKDRLYKKFIVYVPPSSSNIVVTDLSPKSPWFELTKISSARLISIDKINYRHFIIVDTAIRIIAKSFSDLDYSKDLAANLIFARFFQAF